MPYVADPAYVTPPPETVLWRYLSFPKFLSMLATSSLQFTRPDLLHKFEGSVPLLDALARDAGEPIAQPPAIMKSGREVYVVNCWHRNTVESAAMWALYVGTDDGIAVRSSVAGLVEAVRAFRNPMFLANVRYLDYQRERMEPGNLMRLVAMRPAALSHEQEVRLITFNRTGPPRPDKPDEQFSSSEGLRVHVDLKAMISELRVAPGARPWLLDLARETASEHGLAKDLVNPSTLDEEPTF